MIKSIKLQFLVAALAALTLFGCFSTTDNGTEIPNELAGRIVTQDGKPAADAKVTLYPVGYVPGDTASTQAAKFTTTTDANGRYAVAKISVGQYNILGSKDSLLSFSDSVSITQSSTGLPTDTLNTASSLSGNVQLQPQDDPRTATVQVLGTDDYTNVDSAGNFILPALAKGEYQLRAVTILPNYVPLFKAVSVQAGSDDTLPEPLILIYTGIPVVTGITASLDTAAGIAKVGWNPAHYSGFLSYLVYRDVAGALTFSQTPINTSRITDTFYLDTLYRSAADSLSQAWEYRVRVQDVNGNLGSPFELAVLNAVPPRTVQTAIQMRVLGNHHDSASIKDTVRIVADFNNPTYANQRLAWFIGGSTDTVRSRSLNAKSGLDTLVWVAPDTTVTEKFSIRILDSAGRKWSDSIAVSVVLDPPVANAGDDTTVSRGTAFTLRGKAIDAFGQIVKWEWDIGGAGNFIATPSGDTTFVLPMTADSILLCILRVTDDDGLMGLDTVKLTIAYPVSQNEFLSNVIWNGNQLMAVGDSGVILTSADGLFWTPQKSGTINVLRGAVWADGQFVVEGEAPGTSTILTSPDGVTWTSRGSGLVGGYSAPAWTGSKFVVAGFTDLGEGTIYTSPDGIAWTGQSIPGGLLASIAWTGNQLVVVQTDGTDLTSTDGIHWNTVPYNPESIPAARYVTWTGNQLLAIGLTSDTIYTSLDAITWNPSYLNQNYYLKSVIWADSQYVAVGGDSYGTKLRNKKYAELSSVDGESVCGCRGRHYPFLTRWYYLETKYVRIQKSISITFSLQRTVHVLNLLQLHTEKQSDEFHLYH